MESKQVVKGPGEGERRWFMGGGTHTWKVRAEESGGAFAVFEDALGRGKMTPMHCHPDTDELVYVLEGEILVNTDGEERTFGAGSLNLTPRGTPHAFMVLSETAKLLVIEAPGKAEAFYYGASIEATSDEEGPVDFGQVVALAQSTQITSMLGPPPFASAAAH